MSIAIAIDGPAGAGKSTISKAAAKANAEEWLAQWKSGEATEDSFAALANEKSADGDGTTGGLYEDILPVQGIYEENFTNWAVDPSRKVGDTGLVETSHGWHIMFYASDDELTYRDYLIETQLRDTDFQVWQDSIISSVSYTVLDISELSMDLVLYS